MIVLMVLLDLYIFQAVKVIAQPAGGRTKMIIYSAYWIISIAAIVVLLILPYLHFAHQEKILRTTIFAIILGMFIAKLVGALFLFIDDIRRGIQWIVERFSKDGDPADTAIERKGISRSIFLSWAGMVAGGGLFATLMNGFGNKYRYQVKRIPLSYGNLPPAFRGLKIVHISDIHSGSLMDKNAVIKGIDKIMQQKPDLILFTGDLVNNVASEMEAYLEVFGKLKAPMGVYSTLGNHDYGDYVQWGSAEEKRANLEKLKEVHAQMGWRLLMNEHIVLEKGGEKIALLGIENWSAKARFPKYGNMEKAYAGADAYPFKILLSHDPSHWDAEVRLKYPDIDLMLSGHTHGMQFGVELPGFKWSPVQYVYEQWAGLYEKSAQKLYVNRGYGFIGYPGRVGILPEITVLELA
jgi:predicted MPP superfamily phosphohydrolase